MATVYKATTLFQVTTVAGNPRQAVPHTGGWSESWWTQTDPLVTMPTDLTQTQLARASLLPAQANVIGLRVQKYDMTGNRLTPQGTRILKLAYPGRSGIVTDLPQCAVAFVVTNNNSPNKANMLLRCIPDDYLIGGEWQPDTTYQGLVTRFFTRITSGRFGFIGRDRSQASTRVLSASPTDGVLVDGIPSTGLVVNDWVRFNRTVDNAGVPISRPYKVLTIVGNKLTLEGWTAIVAKPSGTLRRDLVGFFLYNQQYLGKATVKKIGSPFERYRGRRSKKRV